MKEELQGKLLEILTSMQTAAGKASDFAMEQLPDIAQSYVAYGRAMESVGVLFALAVFLTALIVGLKYCAFNPDWVEKEGWAKGRWTDSRVVLTGACMGVGFFAFMALTMIVPRALLVWFAPKVWLLKEIAGMLK